VRNKVKDQYEAYPYPARDPAEESNRLVTGSPSRLLEIDHYLFRGQRDWRRPFRALVAGGGTGDGLVMLTQQLADAGVPAQVTYLDLSSASRAIAQARIAARGLAAQVTFVSGSLLDLPQLGLEDFDYIDCCGVLHHLADPSAGLAALAGALAPGGGLGIMVYGEYGRAGLYPLQAALRQLGAGLSLAEKITQAEQLLTELPATNGFSRNPFLGDHQRGPAELVDLLLHPQDRAYTVPQLQDWVHGVGLTIAGFIEPLRYDPRLYLTDPDLRARAAALPLPEQAALAERLAGNMKTHTLYLSREADSRARFLGGGSVPVLVDWQPAALARSLAKSPVLKGSFDGLSVELPLPPEAPALLSQVDGQRSFEQIYQTARRHNPNIRRQAFLAVAERLVEILGGINRLLLRNPGPPDLRAGA
jgi:SAM-dependent methyltransferase|tara:strand:- start:283 stop:1536 length:1254 start_codon:yes stop_codon:yes gene_type:complete